MLANGGFEEGAAGWSYTAGSLDAVTSPVHGGAFAGHYSGTGPTAAFVYQLVGVQPAQNYELSGWAAASGSGVSRVFLRVSWFDGNGQFILSEDSPWLSQADGAFHELATGPRLSPTAAQQARVSVLVQGDSAFTVYLDDFAFSGPAAIPPPPATPTPAPIVTPTGPATPAITPSPAPTRTPAASPPSDDTVATPAPAVEPAVFPHLVNGGFEDLRADSTPYGWRKQGGEMDTAFEPRTEGSRALLLRSETASTKWVYQTVAVQAGAYYEASVDAFTASGAEEVFLRLSWYASGDGSGTAIDSADSTVVSGDDGHFRRTTTGPVQAPSGAQTVKVRLMLRPSSEAPAAAFFDGAALATAQPEADEIVRVRGGAIAVAGQPGAPQITGEGEAAVAGVATPVALANVKPERDSGSEPAASPSRGRYEWAVLLAIGSAVVAVGLAGAYELWQRRYWSSGSGDEP